MKLIILALLFSAAIQSAYAQWFQHTGIPVTTSFSEVCFPDPGHGWIVGTNGTILHTGDGGVTWNQQSSNTAVSLSGISMPDSLHGWAVGHSSELPGLILRTNDAGNTWESTDTSDHSLSDVFFVDSLRGWVIGANVDLPAPGLVKVTMDGGNTWTDQLLPEIMIPNEVVFVNPQVGFIGGTHRESDHFRLKVLKTTNGGMTWATFINWGTDGDMYFSDLMFLDSLTGWISGSYYAIEIGGGTNDNGFITKIENGSAGWYNFIYEDYWKPTAICFTSNDSGWCVGQSGLFMDTQDNGGYWTFQYLPPGLLLTDITFADEDHGWAVGNNGTVMYTDNNGYTGIVDNLGNGNEIPEWEIFPNPASREVNIRFEMKSAGQVTGILYNASGRPVVEIINDHLPQGSQTITWSVAEISGGFYIIRIIAGEEILIEKMIVQ